MTADIGDQTIAVVGLGYVGLPLAIEFAKVRDVIGFDINSRRINSSALGIDETLEVDGDDLAAATRL